MMLGLMTVTWGFFCVEITEETKYNEPCVFSTQVHRTTHRKESGKEKGEEKLSDSKLDSRFRMSASLNCVSRTRGKRSRTIIVVVLHACVHGCAYK